MWKLDTTKKGYKTIFKEYQLQVINYLLAHPDKGIGSGEAWRNCQAFDVKVSRASIIFFLNALVEDGLATFRDATGKGGHHRLYQINDGWVNVEKHIITRLLEGMQQAFPDNAELEIWKTLLRVPK